MVKNYKKKPLNAAASGYTPPPPTGTPLYQPEEEAVIPERKNANIPPRRMNPPRPMNAMNSVPPARYQSKPMNQGYPPPQQYQQQPQPPPRFNSGPGQFQQPQYQPPPQQYQNQYQQQPQIPPRYNNPPPQQYNNNQYYQQSPPMHSPPMQPMQHNSYPGPGNNGPMIPPRRDRYETNYNTPNNGAYYSEPAYRMPFPK